MTPPGFKTWLLTGAALLVTAAPSWAATLDCKAVLELHGPAGAAGERLPGTYQHQGSQHKFSYSTSSSGKQATTTIEIDTAAKTAVVTDSSQETPRKLDYARLQSAKFSAMATVPESLGGLVFVGDRLKAQAKFLRNGTYAGQPVQVYSFVEDATYFGQIFYSVTYGVPVRLDVFDDKKHTRHFIELKGIAQ